MSEEYDTIVTIIQDALQRVAESHSIHALFVPKRDSETLYAAMERAGLEIVIREHCDRARNRHIVDCNRDCW